MKIHDHIDLTGSKSFDVVRAVLTAPSARKDGLRSIMDCYSVAGQRLIAQADCPFNSPGRCQYYLYGIHSRLDAADFGRARTVVRVIGGNDLRAGRYRIELKRPVGA